MQAAKRQPAAAQAAHAQARARAVQWSEAEEQARTWSGVLAADAGSSVLWCSDSTLMASFKASRPSPASPSVFLLFAYGGRSLQAILQAVEQSVQMQIENIFPPVSSGTTEPDQSWGPCPRYEPPSPR